VIKPLICIIYVVFAFGAVSAQPPVWQPSPGHAQIEIWPGAAPDAQQVARPEVVETSGQEGLIAGKPVVSVSEVSRPTMTVYSLSGKNTGAAVVVFPEGGYLDLAIDLEGTEVCDWLTAKGITCVLLKYRVPGEPGYPKPSPYPKSGPYPESPMAFEDAQSTMGLVRFHAEEWHIDPHNNSLAPQSVGKTLSLVRSPILFQDT
jgi:acetyl esterase/lipase